MKAEQILKRIGHDNDSITTTEKWIAETVYKLAMEDAAALRQPPVMRTLPLCDENGVCRICGTGGWNCDSDSHK